jgi:hypothetical protein
VAGLRHHVPESRLREDVVAAGGEVGVAVEEVCFRYLLVVVKFQVPVPEYHQAGVFPHVCGLLDDQVADGRGVFGRFFDLDVAFREEYVFGRGVSVLPAVIDESLGDYGDCALNAGR